MSKVNIIDSWQTITELSECIVAAANNESWLEVAEMAKERHCMLKRHFDSFPVGPDNASFYTDRLNQLLQQEVPLQALAREARKNLMKYGETLVKGKKMQRAYGT